MTKLYKPTGNYITFNNKGVVREGELLLFLKFFPEPDEIYCHLYSFEKSATVLLFRRNLRSMERV